MTINKTPNQQKQRKAFSPNSAKDEVIGEFNNGYFVMPEQVPLPTTPTDQTKTRTRRPKDSETTPTKTNKAKSFSPATSPTKSTPRVNSPQKAEKTSPSSKRWAGPAFGNAPPPSSLPLPDFSNFVTPSPVTSTAPQPTYEAASPLSLSPMEHYSPAPYTPHSHQQYAVPPSSYHPVHASPIHMALPQHLPHQYAYPSVPFSIAQQSSSLGQLSNDLRRLLNIGDPSIMVQAN